MNFNIISAQWLQIGLRNTSQFYRRHNITVHHIMHALKLSTNFLRFVFALNPKQKDINIF